MDLKSIIIAIAGIALFLLWQDRLKTQEELAKAQEELAEAKQEIKKLTATYPTSREATRHPVPAWFSDRLREKPGLEPARDRFQDPKSY